MTHWFHFHYSHYCYNLFPSLCWRTWPSWLWQVDWSSQLKHCLNPVHIFWSRQHSFGHKLIILNQINVWVLGLQVFFYSTVVEWIFTATNLTCCPYHMDIVVFLLELKDPVLSNKMAPEWLGLEESSATNGAIILAFAFPPCLKGWHFSFRILLLLFSLSERDRAVNY